MNPPNCTLNGLFCLQAHFIVKIAIWNIWENYKWIFGGLQVDISRITSEYLEDYKWILVGLQVDISHYKWIFGGLQVDISRIESE